MEHKLQINKKIKYSKLVPLYKPLQNLIMEQNAPPSNFSTSSLDYDLEHPVEIITQQTYDDSINLILNNDNDSPKIINSGFSVLENGNCEIITRNQNLSTNIYNTASLNQQTDLFMKSIIWPQFDLKEVVSGGQLMGGNYIFYAAYADEDDNISEIVSESSIISIFHNDVPYKIYGTLMDERTDKVIHLKISNLDTAFSKLYLYFTRDTSDLNGISLTKCYKLTTPYDIKSELDIFINGYEEVEEINIEQLNIQYHYYTKCKTHAEVQNRLFVANLETNVVNNEELQKLSYKIKTTLKQKEESIGYISDSYSVNFSFNLEYYDPLNIYYYLGYWPDEYYKFGIVYLYADGTSSPVFSILGDEIGINETISGNNENIISIKKDDILNENVRNSGGVFKIKENIDIIDHVKEEIKPIYFEFDITDIQDDLAKFNVIGYFFVRTSRIPVNLCQALSLGIEKNSGIPTPYVEGLTKGYYVETFLDIENSDDNSQKKLATDSDNNLIKTEPSYIKYSGLLSLDAMVSPQLQATFTLKDYILKETNKVTLHHSQDSRRYNIINYSKEDLENVESKLVYINENIPSFVVNDKYYSTRAGNAENVLEFSFLREDDLENQFADNIVRGVYAPIIGCDKLLKKSSIYTIQIKTSGAQEWVKNLMENDFPYFAVSKRLYLDTATVSVYRGDCFTNTVTIRLNKNFIDPTAPLNDRIVDPDTWKNYTGLLSTRNEVVKKEEEGNSWLQINRGDLNAVPLGRWVTFKCLSNFHLDLRALNYNDPDFNRLYNPGSFYPITDISTKSGNKISESKLLNEGYNKTLSYKRYIKYEPVAYENTHFDTRIAFSNIQVSKAFKNGYRIFQGLAYQDIERQYGAIMKLFAYNQQLLCIFEHGIGVVPVNEKALLSTEQGLSIHLYGAGVLQPQIQVISPDFGSTWPSSLIKTPNAYYGVDSHAKKIWRFNNSGFECISDFKVQSVLNEISIENWDTYFIGTRDIRTHYNNFKHDVIFSFYKDNYALVLCYNELLNIWTSKYSWVPLLSENINNEYYSFGLKDVGEVSKMMDDFIKQDKLTTSKIFYSEGTEPMKLLYDSKMKYKISIDSVNTAYGKSIKVPAKLMYDKYGNVGYYLDRCYIQGRTEINIGLLNNFVGGIIQKRGENWVNWPSGEIYKNDWTITNEDVNVFYNIFIEESEYKDDEENIINDIKYHGFCGHKDKNDIIHFNQNMFPLEIAAHVTINNDKVYEDTLKIRYDKPDCNAILYKHTTDANICQWYGEQHPFEYEFVVNQPAGFHKIFNNLMIISNNVEPDSLEVEIVGDVYDFKEEFISQNENIKYKFPIISLPNDKTYQTKLTLDKVTNEYILLMHQGCLNIKDFGRRLGNISYIEGKWYIVLQPIYYEDKTLKTTRLRDKWAKIRIKYSGEKLAIITAIQTLMNISYV